MGMAHAIPVNLWISDMKRPYQCCICMKYGNMDPQKRRDVVSHDKIEYIYQGKIRRYFHHNCFVKK